MARRLLLILLSAAFAWVYGYFFAILPQELWGFLIIPIALLMGLILWLLPDWDRVSPGAVTKPLLIFLAMNVIWPSYIALSLTGMPWINPQRLALFYLLATGLLKLSTSAEMRSEILTSVRSAPVIWWSFIIFWVTTAYTLLLSDYPFNSFSKWMNNQIYWTFLFVIAAWCALRPGFVRSLALVLAGSSILVALISWPEYVQRKIFWGVWLPNWLIGDVTIFEAVMSAQARLGLDMYRARSTFTNSITFAEFLSMGLPFVLHFAVKAKAPLRRIALGLAAVLMTVSMIMFTNARSGMNGFIIGIFSYTLYWAVNRWRRGHHDIIGASVIYLFPIIGGVFTVLVFTWRRLYVMVFGGGQHSFSTRAREIQWEIGIQKAISNPVGYGTGRAGTVIGYSNPGGTLTLDSYALNLLVDYGIIGLASFAVLVLGAAYTLIKIALSSQDEELELAAPMGIALLAFGVIKTVLSQPENIPLMFVFAGCACGLAYRRYGLVPKPEFPRPMRHRFALKQAAHAI